MIAKAKAISHGINDLRYITGESQHKKHPEKIYQVLDNLLPSAEPDAMGIWNSMQLTLSQYRPIKNSVIRIELSPSPEHTQFYDIEDWQKLWKEFAEEFDKQVITGKDGKVRSCPTNLAGSKYSVWLHTESKGEVPHLHARFAVWMRTVISTTTTTFIFVRNVLPSEWQRNEARQLPHKSEIETSHK